VLSQGAARRLLALILGLYMLLGLSMSLIVPLGEVPDELDHFLYGRYLARERAFPPLSAVAAENPTMEANQPPLYYVMQSLATGWVKQGAPFEPAQNSCFSFETDDAGRQTFYVHTAAEGLPYTGDVLAFHLGRALSLLLGGAAVVLTYGLGRLILPGDRRAALLGAALLGFNPQFIFITSGVNNDVLTAVLGAAIVFLAALAWQRPRVIIFVLLGTAVGLGLLTKAGLFALWPVALLAAAAPLVHLFFTPQGAGRPWRQVFHDALLPLSLVGGIPLLLSGWWYVRTARLYGDPLAWRVHLAAKGPFVLREGGFGLNDLAEFASLHFRSYWALFGWLNVAVPAWVYGLLALLVGLGFVGLLGGTLNCLHERYKRCPFDLAALGLSALAVMATYVSLLRYVQTINWSGYQGRLAFAAAAPTAALLGAGLMYLAQRAAGTKRLWLGGLMMWSGPLFLLGLAAAGVLVLLPAAYSQPGIYQPAGLQKTCARFEGGLLLDGFAAPERISPGETLMLTLAAYGMDGQEGEGVLAAELRGDAGELWATGKTAVTWSSGETVTATIPLAVSAAATPGRATLLVGLRDAAGRWQAAESANGRDLELPLALDTVKLPAPSIRSTPQVSLDADLDGQMRLLGYDIEGDSDMLEVTLHWTALQSMSEDFTTFVHLLDAEGRLLAQADGPPDYPTAVWDVGEVVLDLKRLALPPGLPDGPLQLMAGAYRWRDGERLDEAVTLETFTPHPPPGGAK
jgi:hypothetical protein